MSILYIDSPLVVNPRLAAKIGLNEAIILQQMHYWISKGNSGVEHDGLVWVYNSYAEWVEQFPFWSESTVKRSIATLKSIGVILVEQLNKSKHDRTNYYTISYDHECLNDPVDKVRMTRSTGLKRPDLTETTTETTTNTPIVPASGDEKTVIKSAEYKPEDVVSLFNETCGHVLPKCLALNSSRRRAIIKLSQLKLLSGNRPFINHGLEAWETYFNQAIAVDWNVGKNDRGWKATIDYLLKESSALKIMGI